jgi:hypothetical protein
MIAIAMQPSAESPGCNPIRPRRRTARRSPCSWPLTRRGAFDTEAPLAASAFNDNIDGRTHELKGRFWYLRLSRRF